MKTLKFRIYDKTEKRMKFLDGIWNMPDPSYDFDEIQQFTGLFDRHGKEIYEGDILNFDYPMEVIWDMGSWAVKTGRGSSLLYGYINEGEVIGNVFENKELLTQSK